MKTKSQLNHELIGALKFDKDIDTVKSLIEQGADVNFKCSSEYNLRPLFFAYKNLEMTQLLISHGAKVNIRGFDSDSTLLMDASRRGNIEVVKLLLDNGAYLNAKCKEWGRNALWSAAGSSRTDIIELLIDRGINYRLKDNNGNTILSEIIRNLDYLEITERLDMMQFLLQKCKFSKKYKSSFLQCIYTDSGFQKAAHKLLVNYGADPKCIKYKSYKD